MLAFITGLAIGIVLGNVGLLAVLAWLDVTGDTRNVTAPLQRAEGHVDALAEDARDILARCSDMHPNAYSNRRDRRAGDRLRGGAA